MKMLKNKKALSTIVTTWLFSWFQCYWQLFDFLRHKYYNNEAGRKCALNNSEKIVNITCRVFNEDKPALAENITVYYELDGNWLQPTHQTTSL